MTTELTMLLWTTVLAIIQLLASAQFFTAANGIQYGTGARDTPAKPLSVIGGRVARAFGNLMETFPLAAAAILIAALANRHNALTVGGAQLYFWGRLIYLPVYAAGIPVARSLIWMVSMIGIVLILVGAAIG